MDFILANSADPDEMLHSVILSRGQITKALIRGQSRISEKGFCLYKGVCVGGSLVLILSNFSYIPHENEIIWSH